MISTHAPRTGSDRERAGIAPGRAYFNPRSPHGERRQQIASDLTPIVQFQPTLPARGATGSKCGKSVAAVFQPTLPARGATFFSLVSISANEISTHAPRTGSDKSRSRESVE